MKHWDILGKPHEPRDMTLSISAVIDGSLLKAESRTEHWANWNQRNE